MPKVELERVAIEVPDLDTWVARFEGLVGPVFERHEVDQHGGVLDIAIHPVGIELVRGKTDVGPRLRSFHLACFNLDAAASRAAMSGWTEIGAFKFRGRRHRILNADGLRILLTEGEGELL
jgi:hypothetical protein